jgi:hypothetical protein
MDFEEQAQRLRTHVEQLASDIGERNVFRPTSLQAAASYVEHEWEHQGYAVERLAYDVSGVRCLNLEITRSGGARDREILLIGAHYDTVTGSPGANDNASGVSALVEISRLFASIEPALTVRFVAFVNEEPPFFMTRQQGSTVYAEAARRRGDDIRLMASIETIGWYSSEPGSQRYQPLFNLFYPNRANFKLAHSVGEKHSSSVPMRRQTPSGVRSSAFRNSFLSFAKTCSIGLRSGEYCGRKNRRAPLARMALLIAARLWEPRLSMTTMSPCFKVGARTCST